MATLTTSWQKIGTSGTVTFGYAQAYLELWAKYNSQSIPNNTTNWSIEARLVVTRGYIGEYSGTTLTLSGNDISSSQSCGTGDFYSQTLGQPASGTTTHATDGTKSVSASASIYFSTWGQSISVSGSADLPTIPRYATITSFTVSKRDETSVTYSFSANATLDSAKYSVDNGSTWHNLPTNNVVSGLSANTTYNFKLQVRRADSQLWTTSNTVQQTTYDYPYCSASSNFTIGSNIKISLYNPLKRTVSVKFYGNNNTLLCTASRSINGATEISNTSSEINAQYNSIPSNTSATYKVTVTYGSSTKTRNNAGTYSINANICKPTFSDFEYSTDLSDLTGDTETIINGKTNTTVTISTTNKAVGKNGATIQRYSIQCGTQTPKLVNYSSSSSVSTILNNCNSDILKVTAIDSRGLETTVNKTVTNFKNYFAPTFVSFNVDRENGIDTTAYLDTKLQFWNYNFGDEDNIIKEINYRIKEQGTDVWSRWFTTNPSSWVINEEQLTITDLLVFSDGVSQGFTIGKTYNFQLQVIDGSQNDDLTTTTSDTFNLVDGQVAFSVLKDNNGEYHLGINGMPDLNITLKVHGTIQYNS